MHTFECTAEEGTVTAWKVKLRSCKDNLIEIVLLQPHFVNGTNITHELVNECDSNYIQVVGEGKSTDFNETDSGTHYISELHITLASTCGYAGSTVECCADNGTSETMCKSAIIPGNHIMNL